jgi:hypothetical protein
MPKEPNGKTQQTQPKKGEPATIPVPTRKQVFGDLEKVAKPQRRQKKGDA